MLLVIDIGNSSIHMGIFDADTLQGDWRITTTPHKTSDEYGMMIREFLQIHRLGDRKVDGVALCSVVPPLTGAFCEAAEKYFSNKPLVVDYETPTGLTLLYDPPRDVGADRIANAVAAHQRFKEAVIIVDFGTATTFDVVSSKGEYLGGIIAPGVMVSAEGLFSRAAKLSAVELIPPKTVIGQDTVASVQSGIIYGYASMVDGMIERIRESLQGPLRVLATGGQAQAIVPHCKWISEVQPNLTLEGLRILFSNSDNN